MQPSLEIPLLSGPHQGTVCPDTGDQACNSDNCIYPQGMNATSATAALSVVFDATRRKFCPRTVATPAVLCARISQLRPNTTSHLNHGRPPSSSIKTWACAKNKRAASHDCKRSRAPARQGTRQARRCPAQLASFPASPAQACFYIHSVVKPTHAKRARTTKTVVARPCILCDRISGGWASAQRTEPW